MYASFDQLFENYVNNFTAEFGSKKAIEISIKVRDSKKLNDQINRSMRGGLEFPPDIILNTLNTIPYFMFARGQTQAFAALLVLKVWNDKVNSVHFILDELRVIAAGYEILDECKQSYF